jgi:hypothetical protein
VGFYGILHLRLISYFHTEKDGKHYFVSYKLWEFGQGTFWYTCTYAGPWRRRTIILWSIWLKMDFTGFCIWDSFRTFILRRMGNIILSLTTYLISSPTKHLFYVLIAYNLGSFSMYISFQWHVDLESIEFCGILQDSASETHFVLSYWEGWETLFCLLQRT